MLTQPEFKHHALLLRDRTLCSYNHISWSSKRHVRIKYIEVCYYMTVQILRWSWKSTDPLRI